MSSRGPSERNGTGRRGLGAAAGHVRGAGRFPLCSSDRVPICRDESGSHHRQNVEGREAEIVEQATA